MKTILHIGQFNQLKLKRCFMNQIAPKISNGLTRNGYNVLNYNDRDLLRYFSFGFCKQIGLWRLNRHLVDYCLKTLPDAIILGHADTIYPKTLAKIKELLPDIRILQYNVDWILPECEQGNIDRIASKLDVVDITLVTTGDEQLLKQFKRPGNIVGFLPNPTDESIETMNMFEQAHPTADVYYCAGNGTRQFGDREIPAREVVSYIRRQLPGLKLFFAGMSADTRLNGACYQKSFAFSGMGLNISRRNDVYLYSSDRIAHIMGNGLLCFMDKRSGFHRLFNTDEVVFYDNPEDLCTKIRYYADHPQERQAIAKKGCLKYRRDFNERIVAKYMTDLLFHTFDADMYPFPTVV